MKKAWRKKLSKNHFIGGLISGILIALFVKYIPLSGEASSWNHALTLGTCFAGAKLLFSYLFGNLFGSTNQDS